MQKYIKTFKRVEQKYIFSIEDFKKLMEILELKMEKNKYFESKILNIYFDDDNFSIAKNSIEKTKYKEKVRARCYSVPSSSTHEVFFEIKRKCDGVVSKRRIALSLDEYEKYITNKDAVSVSNSQICKEIDYTLKTKCLKEKMMVMYDRLSYYLKEDEQIRITFDFNLRYRTDMVDFKLGDSGHRFFNEDIVIMEVKTLGSLPIWFVKLMNSFKFYPTSFSKYGEIYKKEILGRSNFKTKYLTKNSNENSNLNKNNNLKQINNYKKKKGIKIA